MFSADYFENLLEALKKRKAINEDDIEFVQSESEKTKKDPIEIIERLVSSSDLAQAKSEVFNIPYIDLVGLNVAPKVLQEIPIEAVSFYKFIPYDRSGNALKVAMVDPLDIKAQEALKFITHRNQLTTQIYITSTDGFNQVYRQYRTLPSEVGEALTVLDQASRQTEQTPIEQKLQKTKDIISVKEEAPISKIVGVIIRHAVEGSASDIHIEPVSDKLKVRFRVDGVLHTSLVLPKRIYQSVVTRVKILANLKIDEQRKPQDGRFRLLVDDNDVDFRISTFPTAFGEKVVIRILDVSHGMNTLEDLGFTGRGLDIILENIKKPHGMVLITGPTGSGKSTTLYSIMNILNQDAVNIVTLEDPVEYYINGVNQSQVRPEIGYTFASGLRSILRQDPNIIMVGEIRDSETAELAVHAALTGHLVLSTLHTNDAIGVIPRLIDMHIEPFLLSASLNLMMAQRLVKKVCPDCREEIEMLPKVAEFIRQTMEGISESAKKYVELKPPYKLYHGVGCRTCANKGTKGRIAIYEALPVTKELEKIIIERSGEAEILKEFHRQGMLTMLQDGLIKSLLGLTTFEEVMKVVKTQ